MENQRNDKWEEINSYTNEEKVTFGLEDEKEIFGNKESVRSLGVVSCTPFRVLVCFGNRGISSIVICK